MIPCSYCNVALFGHLFGKVSERGNLINSKSYSFTNILQKLIRMRILLPTVYRSSSSHTINLMLFTQCISELIFQSHKEMSTMLPWVWLIPKQMLDFNLRKEIIFSFKWTIKRNQNWKILSFHNTSCYSLKKLISKKLRNFLKVEAITCTFYKHIGALSTTR